MECILKIVFWNVRGLHSRAKRTAVRSIISSVSPNVVCLQETKLDSFLLPLVVETLGSCFLDYFFLPASSTRGGILLAWNRNEISISSPYIGQHHITTLVSSTTGAHPWWISRVYGPQEDDEKILFLQDLQETRETCGGPWLLGGDFNLISSSEDKSNGRINRRTSSRFRRFITDMEL